MFASNGWDAAAKESIATVRAATGFLYAKGAIWQYAAPADRRKGAEPLTEAAA